MLTYHCPPGCHSRSSGPSPSGPCTCRTEGAAGHSPGPQNHAAGPPGSGPCTPRQCRAWGGSPEAGPASQSSAQGTCLHPEPTYHQAKGHLLTDAIATHAAFPPMALVTVKLVLSGLGHQADAKAVRVGGRGGESTVAPVLTQQCPCLQGLSVTRETHRCSAQLFFLRAPLRTAPTSCPHVPWERLLAPDHSLHGPPTL